MEMLTRYRHRCLRCNRDFVSSSEKPRFCGKCKSSLWDRPRAHLRSPGSAGSASRAKDVSYQELKAEIEKTKRILELQDDWDGEGSPGYAVETFNRAIAFLNTYAQRLWESDGIPLPVPRIGPGPEASIDLYWKRPRWELLVNISADPSEAASYSAEDDGGHRSRGFVPTEKFDSRFATWLKN